MNMRQTGPPFLVLVALLVLAACAPPAVPPTPTATWTQTPPLVPTSTSTPTPVPTATGTSIPTATATPRPTWTPAALPTATQTPTSQPEVELPIGPLAFISPGQQLLVREPAGAIRAITEEGIAWSPAWSPDGARLAFSYQADDRSPAEVRIYDPADGTQSTVWTDPGELAPLVLPFRKIAWSPSGRHLFLSQGCCFTGALYLLDLESGTLVGRYSSSSEMWSPEVDLLALSVRQPVERLIPIESGDSSSIALVRPGEITPTVVLTGTVDRLYYARAWLSGNELLYAQSDLYEEGKKLRIEQTWWAAEIDSGMGGPPSVIASRSLEALPVKYDDEAFAGRLSPWLPGVTFAEQVWSADGAWVVFRAYGDREAPGVGQTYAFGWEEGPLVGPLVEGIDPALAPTQTSAPLPALPSLTVEAYALKHVPQVEPLAFEPVEGTAKEILQRRRAEREKRVRRTFGIETSVTLGEDRLVATEIYTDTIDGQVGAVQVMTGGSVIYTVPLGQASPVDKLRGLWAYDGHWYLEVADWQGKGQVIRDGESLNERYGYEETFGFQLLRGRPFCFFDREGQIGVTYEGQEILLGYESVHHYGCCSGAELNPVQAENMVAFFALRDGAWYYVEIGVYE